MISLVIHINGKLLSVAGASNLSIMTLFLDAGPKCGPQTDMTEYPSGCDVTFAVMGSDEADNSINLITSRSLKLTDTLTVKVSDTELPNEPLGEDLNEWVRNEPLNTVAFQVKKNGNQLFTAGQSDLSQLHFGISCIGKLGDTSSCTELQTEANDTQELAILMDVYGRAEPVGGRSKDLSWAESLTLTVGDELEIKILDTILEALPQANIAQEI